MGVNEMVLVVATSVGWVGAAGTVGAYALVSQRRLDANSMRFQTINVLGAGLLGVSALSVGNWPSMMSNLVWMFFGVHALVQARHALRSALAARWRRLRDRRVRRGLTNESPDPGSASTTDEIALAA
jgi:hypothetical protein